MTTRGYVQRLVARHAEPLALRPRATPRFGPSPLSIGDADVEGASPPRQVSSADVGRGFAPRRSINAGPPEDPPREAGAARRGSEFERSMGGDAGVDSVDARRLANGSATSTHVELSGVPVGDRAGRKGPPYGDAEGNGAPFDASSMGHTASASDPRPAGRAGLPDDALDMDARDRSSIAPGRRLGGLPRDPQHVGVTDSIHVHIGCIEVRAVAPPPDRPMTSPRAAGPEPLSLDSYLARRARQ